MRGNIICIHGTILVAKYIRPIQRDVISRETFKRDQSILKYGFFKLLQKFGPVRATIAASATIAPLAFFILYAN